MLYFSLTHHSLSEKFGHEMGDFHEIQRDGKYI